PSSTPHPWLWRCHSCRTTYRLGCTRRCLECSHTFCTGPVPPSNKSDSRSRSKHRGPCQAEFDYNAWSAWGSYPGPRENGKMLKNNETFATYLFTLPSPYSSAQGWTKLPQSVVDSVNKSKEKMYMRREHDCWKHCDFPSECRHAVYAACVE
ncbi:hypothetical protein B0T14DRAFT_385471, partial [Immersiella caudata]